MRKKAPVVTGAIKRLATTPALVLLAASKQMQQHKEQIDEVEVETKRAHNGLSARGRLTISLEIHLFDLLRVIGGQARKHQHADHRDCELQGR